LPPVAYLMAVSGSLTNNLPRFIHSKNGQLTIAVIILLVGSALRLQGLYTLTTSLNYDEAYYALDAASLLEHPRLTPFFPDNYGRESAWMYGLAPFLAVFGYSAFGLRLAAAFTGILTLAAVYRLGAELFRSRWAASWSMAGLAVLYWHVHFSHLVWRALLFPLVGTLVFALLWRARRINRTMHWITAGLLLALLAYTYFAARVWLVMAAGMLIYSFVTEPTRRRGVVIAAITACIGILPLIIYTLTNSDIANQRIDDVAVSSVGDVLANLPVWLRLWFIEGANQRNFNLPGRAVLDIPLLVLTGIGLVAVFFAVREKLQGLWIVLLALGSSAIALITVAPENMIRMIGTVIPLALLIGAGAWGIQHVLSKTRLARIAAFTPIILLIWAGFNTYSDFSRWLNQDLYLFFERHLYEAADYLNANTDDTTPLYISPFAPTHPVFRFHAARLAPRPVTGFDATQCWVLAPSEALYYSLTMFDNTFEQRLARYADVEPVRVTERDAIYRAIPHENIFDDGEAIQFENGITAYLLMPLPATIRAGETIEILVSVVLEQPQTDDLTLFLHLYGDPTPYEGGVLWAQADQPLCTSSPLRFLEVGEAIVQPASLTIPAETASGEYDIALGFYRTQSLQRLVSDNLTYTVVQTVQVVE
jgi:4-amino-4-deoxy-L-arabinose transferase-like glycosyltransferase